MEADLDLVIGEHLDEFPRRAVQRGQPAGNLLSHVSLDLVDQAGEDLIDEDRHFRRQLALAFKQQSGHAIEQRVSREARSVLCQ